MMHISELQGIGRGKRALIVGGGESVAEFTQDIPADMTVINCNYPYHGMPVDYMIYWDKVVADEIEIHGKPCETIGYKHVRLNMLADGTDYYYEKADVPMYDTGLNSLYIASEIMCFDEIYLIGYDYTGDHYHDRYEKRNRDKYFSMVNEKYNRKWAASIINMNKNSKLNFFKKNACFIW